MYFPYFYSLITYFIFAVSWTNFAQIQLSWTFFNSQEDGLLKNSPSYDKKIWLFFFYAHPLYAWPYFTFFKALPLGSHRKKIRNIGHCQKLWDQKAQRPKIIQFYTQNHWSSFKTVSKIDAPVLSIFEIEKFSVFFKQVRISPEIDIVPAKLVEF